MKKEQLHRYRTQLRALADRTQKTARGLEEQVRTPAGGEAGGGLSNAPIHLGDLGSETYTQELSATLLENETYIRDEALLALERIDRGTYGRCEHCGQDILLERLDAVPYTSFCTACAAQVQAGRSVNLNAGRPNERRGPPGPEGADRTEGQNFGGALGDTHASRTPGGGTARGGPAGTNIGTRSPRVADLEAALGNGRADAPNDTKEEHPEARSGATGGAVGGTPAHKRARRGRAHPSPKSKKKPRSKRPKE
jgi:RNA polymerase-binding transcription factor DksA